ncbi:Protein RDM1 [Forsythia ovata]|uniref:Protein RDM1 n=1 Tax=Forsythia ovata TaxID=205694 RepID=A0ABD1PYN3_9LAMI
MKSAMPEQMMTVEECKQPSADFTMDQPAKELSSEEWLLRRAKGYQEYMNQIRVPTLRIGAEDEQIPLDTTIHPCKAEASIWLIEEVHRLTTSHHHLAKLWLADPMHHAYIDPIFPQLQA